MSALPHYGADPHLRRLCSILRSLLNREGPFATFTDLKAAFTDELSARYHLAYDGWDIDQAFELVGSDRPLVQQPPRPRLRTTSLLEPPPRLVSDTDAAAILDKHGLNVRGIGADPAHEARVRAQADGWRGRGNDPAAERKRDQNAAAAERITWERTQGAK